MYKNVCSIARVQVQSSLKHDRGVNAHVSFSCACGRCTLASLTACYVCRHATCLHRLSDGDVTKRPRSFRRFSPVSGVNQHERMKPEKSFDHLRLSNNKLCSHSLGPFALHVVLHASTIRSQETKSKWLRVTAPTKSGEMHKKSHKTKVNFTQPVAIVE